MKPILGIFLLISTLARAGVADLCNPACATQPAQCCNVPQADTFAAYESDTHEAAGQSFRLLSPANQAALPTCTTDATITSLLQNVPQPDAVFQTFDAPSLGGVILRIKLKLLFASLTGAENGSCFKLDTQGLVHISPIMFTDGCGEHTFSIGQPKYACIFGDVPNQKTLVCFAAKGDQGILPPGTDRLEDVCALVDLIQ
jgi:hypothetical protein